MAVAGLIGATVLLAACGESRHANEQRPNVSTRVSVTISPTEVIVQPLEIGVRAEPTQEAPQNENDPEPPIKTKKPLDVTFVAANQTPTDAKLKIRGPGMEKETETVFARSPGTFPVELRAGSYTITAVGLPDARPGHLTVGTYRASSQNDVLLP
ncbi:MAG TPA: hypothetical protein VFU16_05390 [Solirubrobacterales bacterium]|nr:hypothetical protein [Solirubrobacterales bacterium]